MKTIYKKDQRGVAHLGLILLVVAVLGAVGFVGWRVTQKDQDNKSSVATGAKSDSEVEKACLKELDDKDLCKFASTYSLDKISYASVMSNTDKDGKKSAMEMENDGKNNYSMVLKENGSVATETIYLNGATYVRNTGENTWTKFPANESMPTNPAEVDSRIADKETFTKDNPISYKKLVKESCGKLSCLKYQVVDKEKPSNEQFIWFDTKHYLMQRYTFKDAEGSSDMTFTYKAVNIKEPSPVKEFSAGSSADMEAALRAAQEAAGSQE